MRFSEAMRLGAMLRPRQAFHVLYDPETDASCAFGAAADAMGLIDTTKSNTYAVDAKANVPAEWRWLGTKEPRQCPACERREDMQNLVFHLNNDHRWTRERIAYWIEVLESAQETNAVDPHVRVKAE